MNIAAGLSLWQHRLHTYLPFPGACRHSSHCLARYKQHSIHEAHSKWWHNRFSCNIGARLIPLVAATTDPEAAFDFSDDNADTDDVQLLPSSVPDVHLPSKRYQRKLDIKEIKPIRARSNTAAKEKTLIRMTAGQNGITASFLAACMEVLMKHDLLRIKLGEGSGLEREEAARLLEQYLDAVVVHQIGYTVTVYREKGLPRPSNFPQQSAVKASDAEPTVVQEDATVMPQSAGKPPAPLSKSARNNAAAKAQQAAAKKHRPPEIELL